MKYSRKKGEHLNPEQKRIYRSMTPTQELRVALRLCHSARQLKESALRARYKNWAEEEIKAKVREIFILAGT